MTAKSSESECDDATEGASWKVQHLSSAPVDRSILEMQNRESDEFMPSSAASTGEHPPADGCCTASVMQNAVINGFHAWLPCRRQ